ncbi:MAG: hypothetical protein ACKVWV_10290 [Planctomycetota bacterium]
MFARRSIRWTALTVLFALALTLWPTAAQARPVQAACTGCAASSGPHPVFFSAGMSCGVPVGLRLAVTNFNGTCVAGAAGLCVPGNPCSYTIQLFYISACPAVLAMASTCGPFPFPAILPPVPVFTPVAAYTKLLRCGLLCRFRFSIRCTNCPTSGATVGAVLKCSKCQ